MRDDLRRHLPSLGWLALDGAQGMGHMSVPSDLYMMTVYRAEPAACADGEDDARLDVMVTSLRTRATPVASPGAGHLALALLTPLGVLHVLRRPLGGITDQRLPIDFFCDAADTKRLREIFMSTASAEQRMQSFGCWLEGRTLQRHRLSVAESRVAQASALMQADDEPVPDMASMARMLAIQRRQLERDFQHCLGATPAFYARLVRFARAAAALAEGAPILHAALDNGYADQSHLTRTVRNLAGVTPRQLRIDASLPGRAAVRRAFGGRVLKLSMPQA
jgi:AraC-like DNA-binding protein